MFWRTEVTYLARAILLLRRALSPRWHLLRLALLDFLLGPFLVELEVLLISGNVTSGALLDDGFFATVNIMLHWRAVRGVGQILFRFVELFRWDVELRERVSLQVVGRLRRDMSNELCDGAVCVLRL